MIEDRKLTDDDVEAIVKALEQRMTKKFYEDLGKGVWAWVIRVIIAAAMFFAAYGAVKGASQ